MEAVLLSLRVHKMHVPLATTALEGRRSCVLVHKGRSFLLQVPGTKTSAKLALQEDSVLFRASQHLRVSAVLAFFALRRAPALVTRLQFVRKGSTAQKGQAILFPAKEAPISRNKAKARAKHVLKDRIVRPDLLPREHAQLAFIALPALTMSSSIHVRKGHTGRLKARRQLAAVSRARKATCAHLRGREQLGKIP